MLLFPLRFLWAVLYGLWESTFNRAVLGSYPSAMMRFRVSGTPSLLTYDLLGRDTARFLLPRRSGKTLDYGCGCGRVSRHIPNCDGIDLDLKAQGWCAKHLSGNYNGIVGEYDSVICISVLSHVDRKTAVSILNQINSSLRIGGKLFVTTHKITASNDGYKFKKASVMSNYFSTASYGIDEFKSLLLECGFHIRIVELFTPSPNQMIVEAVKV